MGKFNQINVCYQTETEVLHLQKKWVYFLRVPKRRRPKGSHWDMEGNMYLIIMYKDFRSKKKKTLTFEVV